MGKKDGKYGEDGEYGVDGVNGVRKMENMGKMGLMGPALISRMAFFVEPIGKECQQD